MRRREFVTLISSAAAALPLTARAQQQATTPVLGFLHVESAQKYREPLAAFLKGLGEAGFSDGRNVKIEYRWAEEHNERLAELAADLVRKQVSVVAATSTPAAIAAKAATTTIPIIFETASDPIRLGLVASLNRPGGNISGITQINVEVLPKRLELMRELLPGVNEMAVLIDQADPALAEGQLKDIQAAALALGMKLHVVSASTDAELETAFAELSKSRTGLVISTDPFFTSRPTQLAALSAHYAVPAISKGREFALAGGLVSYGSDTADAYRLAGVYTGRVLKGERAADLPVQQATKVELFINLKTAKALGISVPLPLSGRADELFE